MRNLAMYFESGELTEVIFEDDGSNTARASVRGKTGGVFRTAGSFQWTSAVKALALLMVKTCLQPSGGMIKGDSGSLAASLDYAISKQPLWLGEMFGNDKNGICLVRRLILRTNPERKRPGPVTLGINQTYLPANSVRIFADGHLCSGEELANLWRELEQLEQSIEYHRSAA